MAAPILAPRLSCLGASIAPKPKPVQMHSELEWAALYPEMERLYVRERRKLRYVMQCMASEHDFNAT
jgi:hypothetical protein